MSLAPEGMTMSHATMTYDEILAQVRELEPVEQADLLEELAGMIKQRLPGRKERSILEIEGLGAEIWEGIDAREYVRKEREAWDG